MYSCGITGGVGRRVEVVLAGDPHHRKQRVAPGVGQRRTHPAGRGGLGYLADRPVRGYPLSRGVKEDRSQVDRAVGPINVGGLRDRNLLAAQGLPNDV